MVESLDIKLREKGEPVRMDAYLVLRDGTRLRGKRFGYSGKAVGELIFNTGMVGYLEILSDPRSYGQIICQTFPLIGNYGVIPADLGDGSLFPSAYIVRHMCQVPSNFRSEGDLDTFLRDNKIPGLCDIDTRALTRIIREQGEMNAIITDSPELTEDEEKLLEKNSVLAGVRVTSTRTERILGSNEAERTIAVLDLGAHRVIAEELLTRNCRVKIMPYNTSAEAMMAGGISGIVISAGSGNPSDYPEIIREIVKMADYKLPILGIGLGHQLLALANGGELSRLHHGHRGANIPVREISTGRIRITTQNHGYYLSQIPPSSICTFENIFDKTCEGLRYNNFPGLSLQFFPETSGGPQDLRHIYDEFLKMEGSK